jgi:hypothetical protein
MQKLWCDELGSSGRGPEDDRLRKVVRPIQTGAKRQHLPWRTALLKMPRARRWCQFRASQKHPREAVYNIQGNHDRGHLDQPEGWWFQKWVGPMGEHPETSGVVVVTQETSDWWKQMVLDNPESIIITVHQYVLKETTAWRHLG